jgi:hypothetical protein
MSHGFNGSVVLTQDSAGVRFASHGYAQLLIILLCFTTQHCSLSGPSVCTQKHIRQYFLNGTLPESGTVCAVDAPPFPVPGSDAGGAAHAHVQAVLGVPAEDRELSEAVWKLAKTVGFRFPTGI